MQKATFSRVRHDKNYPTRKTPERDIRKKESKDTSMHMGLKKAH